MNKLIVSDEARENGKRVTIYDWLRLIATIFVIIGHSIYLNIVSAFGGVNYELPTGLSPLYNSWGLVLIRTLAVWVYGFHMPLFFMLSGAVMALRPMGSFDDIVENKIRRLIVPYFTYGWLFVLPVKWLAGYYNKNGFIQALGGAFNWRGR